MALLFTLPPIVKARNRLKGGVKTMRKMNALIVLLVGIFGIVAAGCDSDRCCSSPLEPSRVHTPAPVPTTPICAYAVQESPQNFSYQGGNGGFSVGTSDPTCTWAAASNVGWIGLTAGPLGPPISVASGAGNGSVNYTVAGNGGAARTGTITVAIANKTVTVTQEARR